MKSILQTASFLVCSLPVCTSDWTPQWTLCTKENKEEPHGRWPPAPDSCQRREFNCCYYLNNVNIFGPNYDHKIVAEHWYLLIKAAERAQRVGYTVEANTMGAYKPHTCSCIWPHLKDVGSSVFCIYAVSIPPPHKHTLEINHNLPEAGLMALHPLAARPRPRWWTSDSELLWKQEMKLISDVLR